VEYPAKNQLAAYLGEYNAKYTTKSPLAGYFSQNERKITRHPAQNKKVTSDHHNSCTNKLNVIS
jgi:hypothetical protein